MKLQQGAVYAGDNGRLMCAQMGCAGATATATGRDLSGQRLQRVTVEDVADWPADLGPMGCEGDHVTLTAIAGPDGWPLPRTTVPA